MKKTLVVAITLIALGIVVKSCTSSSAESTSKSTKPTETEITQNIWKYDSSVSEMGDKSLFAEIEANEKVYMEFPYNGGSTGTLIVRSKNGKKSAMFIIDKGQIDTDYDGTYVRIKFDDEVPQKWSASGPSDNSSDVLFFNNETKLINKLKTTKKVVLADSETNSSTVTTS